MLNVDNQLLCDVEKCDAIGVAKHVLGLRSKQDKIKADIGNVFHESLEAHFKGSDKAITLSVFERSYDEKARNWKYQPEDESLTKVNCKRVMERFCDVRPVSKFPFIPVEFEKVVGAELAPGIVFWGKRDLRVQDKMSGMYSPLDHKTRFGVITDWWAKKYRMLAQMSGYCWLEGQISGIPCLECYVNAVEVKGISSSDRKCPEHKVSYRECGVRHLKQELLTYSRTPEMLESWKRSAIIIAKKFEVLQMAFGDLNYLQYVDRNGVFKESCTFCDWKEWCAAGFKPEMWGEFAVYDKWEPWKEMTELKKDPFEGLVPGTEEYMKFWRENSGMQEEMVRRFGK